jgi:MFS family permease
MQSVAQAWLVYRLTGSSLALGAVSFTGQVPVFLLATVGGAVADRASRHRLLLATQSAAMVFAFLLAALTLSGRVVLVHVFVLAAALGCVNAFDIPIRQSFVVEMVGPEDLGNAIALNSSMVNGARLVGPAIAGLVVNAIGEGWCFVANGVSFLAVITGLLAMRVEARASSGARPPGLRHAVQGFRFVAGHPMVRALLALLGFTGIAGMPYMVLMPMFADRILHGGPRALGILMGASGCGALLGALALAGRRDARGLGRWVVASVAVFGLCLVAFSRSQSFWLSVCLLVPAGAGMMIEIAAINTLVQTFTPDSVRGRVMAVYTMMFLGTAPFGALLAGSVADHVGPEPTVAVGGALCVVAALLFGWHLPALNQRMAEIATGA